MHGEPFTEEQAAWIKRNVSYGVFRDKKHFLAVFNALFNDNRTLDSIIAYFRKNNLTLRTKHNTPAFSEEQTEWIKEHYSEYEVFADFLRAYNDHWNSAVGYANLSSYCVTLKLRKYDSSRRKSNAGQFKKGFKYGPEECPIGSVRYNKQRDLAFVKVQMCGGKSRETTGHNLKEPFWKPLQDKVWEDAYGEIQDGYMACPTNCNPYETDIEHIALIDKRGKAIMGRKRWWSDNELLNRTAIRWCNLYYLVKDSEERIKTMET